METDRSALQFLKQFPRKFPSDSSSLLLNCERKLVCCTYCAPNLSSVFSNFFVFTDKPLRPNSQQALEEQVCA